MLSEDGIEIARLARYLGRQTNNFAEYSGLIAALEWALEHHVRELEVVSDSELLVRQMNGVYRVKSATLKPLFEQARELTLRFRRCSVRHVRRDDNRTADSLANEALDAQTARR